MPINDKHWLFEDYKERISTKDWKAMLWEERDTLIFNGNLRQFVAKKSGYGLVEISKEPLGE